MFLRLVLFCGFLSMNAIGLSGAQEPEADASPRKAHFVADPWVGAYTRVDQRDRADAPRTVRIEKVSDGYRLKGAGAWLEEFLFVETSPGVLWDQKHALGTISLGTLTSAPGRLGAHPPQTVLTVEFCYEFYYLFQNVPAFATTQPSALAVPDKTTR